MCVCGRSACVCMSKYAWACLYEWPICVLMARVGGMCVWVCVLDHGVCVCARVCVCANCVCVGMVCVCAMWNGGDNNVISCVVYTHWPRARTHTHTHTLATIATRTRNMAHRTHTLTTTHTHTMANRTHLGHPHTRLCTHTRTHTALYTYTHARTPRLHPTGHTHWAHAHTHSS